MHLFERVGQEHPHLSLGLKVSQVPHLREVRVITASLGLGGYPGQPRPGAECSGGLSFPTNMTTPSRQKESMSNSSQFSGMPDKDIDDNMQF